MRLSILAFIFSLAAFSSFSQGASGYKLKRVYKLASGGGWDYIAVNDHKLYISHATQVNILNEENGDSLGYIPGTTGVHGIAFVNESGKGYISCGRLNSVTVFDLKTNAVLKQIAVGQNPDAIMYDSYSKKIITCNGRSLDLSIIDPKTDIVEATIALPGKPETAVSDEAGKIYVNIEDRNAISSVDMKTRYVMNTWPLSPAEGPTGLAINLKTKQLFAGCDKWLVVIDTRNGNTLNQLPIASGCDGVAFDASLNYIFASCGEGVLSIASANEKGDYKILDHVSTKKSARTIAIDLQTHEVFLPAAEFGPAIAGQRAPVIPGTFQILVFGK